MEQLTEGQRAKAHADFAETFAAHGAYPALGIGVGIRCTKRRPDDVDLVSPKNGIES